MLFNLPGELQALVEFAHPNYLDASAERHSELCWTVWVWDIDYSYYVWRAHYSVDGRWTLSPVDHGPVQWDNQPELDVEA